MRLNVIGELNDDKIEEWLLALRPVKFLFHHPSIKPEPEVYDVVVCSEGGDEHAYTAFIDLFARVRDEMRLKTTAVGRVMSGAPLLVANGSPGHRRSYASTMWGLHLPYLASMDEDSGAQDIEIHDIEKSKAMYCSRLEQVSKHTRRWWRKLLKGKSMVYFDAQQALRWGLIDTVIGG